MSLATHTVGLYGTFVYIQQFNGQGWARLGPGVLGRNCDIRSRSAVVSGKGYLIFPLKSKEGRLVLGSFVQTRTTKSHVFSSLDAAICVASQVHMWYKNAN